jgi:hypothetical protein
MTQITASVSKIRERISFIRTYTSETRASFSLMGARISLMGARVTMTGARISMTTARISVTGWLAPFKDATLWGIRAPVRVRDAALDGKLHRFTNGGHGLSLARGRFAHIDPAVQRSRAPFGGSEPRLTHSEAGLKQTGTAVGRTRGALCVRERGTQPRGASLSAMGPPLRVTRRRFCSRPVLVGEKRVTTRDVDGPISETCGGLTVVIRKPSSQPPSSR